jgi:hypothetical protein
MDLRRATAARDADGLMPALLSTSGAAVGLDVATVDLGRLGDPPFLGQSRKDA